MIRDMGQLPCAAFDKLRLSGTCIWLQSKNPAHAELVEAHAQQQGLIP